MEGSPQSPPVDAAPIHAPLESVDANAAAADAPLFYKHLAVNSEPGLRLLGVDGNSLRASKISIWVDDIFWRYAFGGPAIESPLGNGTQPPGNFQYGFAAFGIVLLNPTQASIFSVRSDSPANPQEVLLNNGLDIVINVNDVIGTYGDNNGAYSLNLTVLQP